MPKQLTLIFNHFETEHLGKDVFLVPLYLGKQLGYDVTIVYPLTETNKDFPLQIRGVKLVPLRFRNRITWFPLWRTWNFYTYLIKHASRIDLLMRFHYSLHSILMTLVYKTFRPKGKVYIKMDIDSYSLLQIRPFRIRGIKNRLKLLLCRNFVHKVDKCSCETLLAYTYLKVLQDSHPLYALGSKLQLMPNGFDEDTLQDLQIKERDYAKKENLIITVGRLGTYQKNTEMFLDALKKVDLQGWKCCLIGPVDESFKSNVENFFQLHPEKKESVIFTGPIYDKKELWEYYNKAKVFVLTSRYESYGLVLNEAKRFRNYLLSTEVGAYNDLSENGKYGCLIPQDNSNALASILKEVVIGKRSVDVYKEYDVTQLSWENVIKSLNL